MSAAHVLLPLSTLRKPFSQKFNTSNMYVRLLPISLKKGRLVSVMYSPILLAGSVAVLGTGCTGCCVCARQLGCDMLLPRAPCHLCCLPSWVCQGAAVSMKYFNDGKVLIIATIREISNENNK